MVTNEELTQAYKAALEAIHYYDEILARACRERYVPLGFSVDHLGDGQPRPAAQCSKAVAPKSE